jgi:hypothetical protein
VDDISLRRWRRTPATGGERPYNVAVLLHAASTMPNRIRLRNYDRAILMSALVSMLERLPVRNVRLSVFNMDRQTELYHTDELTSDGFRQATDSLNRLELGVVDYSTLKNTGGHIDLLLDLIRREAAATDRPDAIIFLGPWARWSGRVPEQSLPDRSGIPPIYYVQIRPWRLSVGVQPDTISRTVRSLGGRTKEVYTPGEFAEAIQELERLLAAASGSGGTAKLGSD